MSVGLGLAAFSLDTFQSAMARELGGWDYNDLWAQNLQMPVSMPYTAPLPYNLEALSSPYTASTRYSQQPHFLAVHALFRVPVI